MSDSGKGSRPRPYSVSQQEYDTRWDAIFGRDGLDDTPAQKSEQVEQSEVRDTEQGG
jgi:hypothetical protein